MKRNRLPIATAILAVIIVAIFVFTIITYNKEMTERKNNIDSIGMKLIIDNQEYPVKLSNNNTTIELLNTLPYSGSMAIYEESFYIININKEFSLDGERVNDLEAQNIYYNPAWKSLVLVYKDYKYNKNKMVHIGSIKKNFAAKEVIEKVIISTKKD